MAMTEAKAVRVLNFDPQQVKNGLANVELKEVQLPEPGNGEALIKIYLRPINPHCINIMAGKFPGFSPPFTAGTEAVATVVKSTSGKFAEGQRVAATSWTGSWATHAVVDESTLVAVPECENEIEACSCISTVIANVPTVDTSCRVMLAVPPAQVAVPEGMSDEAAAQLRISTMTAIGLVDTAAVPKGEWLLQAAAGTGVGQQVIRYAKHNGVKTINIIRRREQREDLLKTGADEVIVSTEEDVVSRVKDITGGAGVYAALDPIAGTFTSTMLHCMRTEGTVYVYGLLSGDAINVKVTDILATGKGLRAFRVTPWFMSGGLEAARERMQNASQLFADGVLTPPTGTKIFKLEDFRDAIAAQQDAARGSGKIYLSSE